ncbi:hypothetical protein CRE_02520 [Caenorhabditis remanei]|uniref:Serpentine receptor class gamma n=1 Tax=Caenorhabditis remanei TaxID=31234 RepID=E3MWP8_CAERE|nr:hypothetical protein CRE_02520 [Caenorhabditis remanei]
MFYFMINLILILSALLYIPIMLKVQKLSRVSSTVKTDQYILFQTLTIVGFKASHSWVICFATFMEYPAIHYILYLFTFDITSTPVLIQVSYILCNKRHLEVL